MLRCVYYYNMHVNTKQILVCAFQQSLSINLYALVKSRLNAAKSKSVGHCRASSGIRFLAKRIRRTQTANRRVNEPRFLDSY